MRLMSGRIGIVGITDEYIPRNSKVAPIVARS